MIAHRINRERKASSPARLIKYMVAAKGGIDPTSWERTADYILDSANGTTEGEKVGSYRVTNCGMDDPADAAILIQTTQAANTRSKAEKTYHFVYSFPPGEQPDLETLHAIEDELCAAIGLDEHQRVSAVHIDTDNLHVHVAINKVHPTGLQNIEPYYDQFRLMEACERLEVKHGLQRTFHGLEAKQRYQNRDIELLPAKAPEQRDSLFRKHLRNAYDLSISEPPEAKTLNGLRKLSDTRLQRQSVDKAEPVRIGAKVASVEAQSGIETLTGYAARELAPAMRGATSWQELHDAAAEHGPEVRQRGAGLVIGEPDLGIWAKASNVGRDLSMKALTDRLGPFQPSERQAEAKANRKRYEPRPRRPDNPPSGPRPDQARECGFQCAGEAVEPDRANAFEGRGQGADQTPYVRHYQTAGRRLAPKEPAERRRSPSGAVQTDDDAHLGRLADAAGRARQRRGAGRTTRPQGTDTPLERRATDRRPGRQGQGCCSRQAQAQGPERRDDGVQHHRRRHGDRPEDARSGAESHDRRGTGSARTGI